MTTMFATILEPIVRKDQVVQPKTGKMLS